MMDEFDAAFAVWLAANFEKYEMAGWPIEDALKVAFVGGIGEGMNQARQMVVPDVQPHICHGLIGGPCVVCGETVPLGDSK